MDLHRVLIVLKSFVKSFTMLTKISVQLKCSWEKLWENLLKLYMHCADLLSDFGLRFAF